MERETMPKTHNRFLILLLILFLTGCYLVPANPTPTGTHATAATATSGQNSTPVPSSTPEPTPTLTLSPTAAPFALQPGSPAYIANFAYPGAGCAWMGVAGQVFDADGSPVLNLVVSVKGTLGENEIDRLSMTGLPEGDAYGPSGYEIVLSDQTIQSVDNLKIQVLNLNADPLTAPISFDTFEDCARNLVIINFSANNE